MLWRGQGDKTNVKIARRGQEKGREGIRHVREKPFIQYGAPEAIFKPRNQITKSHWVILMPDDISRLTPADDSGSDTARRYTYQAEFAFPFCLNMAIGGATEAVILEHHEDVVVRSSGVWKFYQVKTRDPGLGPWTLADLLRPGGALMSLWRSHKCLESVDGVQLIAALEGPAASSDTLLQNLKDSETHRDTNLVRKVSQKLSCKEEDARNFLDHCTVWDGLPARDFIKSINMDMLSRKAPSLLRPRVESLYEHFMTMIQAAMNGTLGESDWEMAIIHSESLDESRRDLARRKRLDRTSFNDVSGNFKREVPELLLDVVKTDFAIKSALQEKLLRGGAGADVISQATGLRAKASTIEFQRYSSSFDPMASTEVQNVRGRLQIRHTSLRDQYADYERPAVPLWSELITHLSVESERIDPQGIFNKDAYLLLGEICSMVDECILDFGRSRNEA